MQNLCGHLEKRDVGVSADISDSDHISRNQFIAGLKAGSVQRALQVKVKAQATTSFYNVVVDAVALK